MGKDINKLFQLRRSIDKFEKELGFKGLTNAERSVLEYIISTPNATLTSISLDPYFEEYSFSTLKRAVYKLFDTGLIKKQSSNNDKRESILVYSSN